MISKVLIIGASGRVGSHLVKELEKNSQGVEIRLATRFAEEADKWRAEEHDAVVLDLNKPTEYTEALVGVDRVFLLTGYTSDMLFQSKKLVDAAVAAGVSHIVHLGVFTSRNDLMPHYTWHDLVETYIEASGIAWTHIHANVIAESVLVTNPPISETGSFNGYFGDTPQGWVFAGDIGAVAAAVLREGPEKHGGVNYWLSTEVLTGSEIASIFTKETGKEIKYNALNPSELEAYVSQITDIPTHAYMQSAAITMKLTAEGKLQHQQVVHDDVLTVLGRSGTTMAEWARQYFNQGK
jgi:uncharacterized protein YbjT (DUF2867 family)